MQGKHYASIVVWDESVETYYAFHPTLVACSDGATIEKARENLYQAIELELEHRKTYDLPIPDLYALPKQVDVGDYGCTGTITESH